MATLGEAVRVVELAALALGLPGLLAWYIKDRRKTQAEAKVVEGTVSATIRAGEVGSLQAHIAYVEEAFRVERDSKDRQIHYLSEQVNGLRSEVAEKDEQIDELKGRVASLGETVADLTNRLDRLVQVHTE